MAHKRIPSNAFSLCTDRQCHTNQICSNPTDRQVRARFVQISTAAHTRPTSEPYALSTRLSPLSPSTRRAGSRLELSRKPILVSVHAAGSRCWDAPARLLCLPSDFSLALSATHFSLARRNCKFKIKKKRKTWKLKKTKNLRELEMCWIHLVRQGSAHRNHRNTTVCAASVYGDRQ